MKTKSPLKTKISPSQKAKMVIKDSPTVLLVGPMLKSVSRGKIPLPKNIPCLLIDGGKDFFRGKSENVLSLGDCDSSKGPLDILLPVKKDYSDFSFALGLLPKTVKILFLRGFLGGRRDHELFNLGEISHFLRGKSQVMAFFDNEIIALSAGQYELELKGTFSLAVFEKTQVTLTGKCLYQTKKKIFKPLSSLGLSNEGKGKMHIMTNKPLFILIENTK